MQERAGEAIVGKEFIAFARIFGSHLCCKLEFMLLVRKRGVIFLQVVWEQSLTGIQVIYTFLSECSLGENYKGMSEAGWGRASQACGFRLSLSIGLGVSLA